MKSALLLLVPFLATASPVCATVLTFDITGVTAGGFMPQAYGDRVTSTSVGSFSYSAAGGFTPNVVVDYVGTGTQTDLNFWTTGYSDLTNVVLYEPDFAAGFRIRLTADDGFLVKLDGFDLGNFAGQLTIPSLRVEDGLGNILFSRTSFLLEANTQPHQDYDFPAALSAPQLNIIIDTTGLAGSTDNIGFDNIQFGQAIPEPSSLMLGALGLLSLGRRSRSRR